jgi:hypothetical protein
VQPYDQRVAERNRVTPTGEIVAIPLRGGWCGNRGILHRGHEVVRSHASDLWITCALSFKDWRLPQWEDRHFTLLFFHDEAVSLAAGHRPCALCRRADYEAYRSAWAAGLGADRPSAKDMNRQLHRERNLAGTSRRRFHPARWADLPAGVFVLDDDGPALLLERTIVPWSTSGYGTPRPRPRAGGTTLVTPPSSAAALRAGYPPQIDPSALG